MSWDLQGGSFGQLLLVHIIRWRGPRALPFDKSEPGYKRGALLNAHPAMHACKMYVCMMYVCMRAFTGEFVLELCIRR